MRIVRLKIKNLRAIGAVEDESPVDIEIDDNNLIFLCGPNNAGKSTILHAYEMFVTASREAAEEDFHGRDPANHIEIEVAIRAENAADTAHQALSRLWDANGIARIRKTWREIGGKGEKQSYLPDEGWQDGGAGGFDTLLQNACPNPVWIRGTSTPEEILGLLKSLVQETILKKIAGEPVYADALAAIQALDEAILTHEYAASLQRNLNAAIEEVFPKVSFVIKNEGTKDVTELFKSSTSVDIHEDLHPNLGLGHHGHGVRRQFIMSAFRGLAMQFEELRKSAKSRRAENYEIAEVAREPNTPKSRMLLIEEPELFLHPSAIRSVRELLYLLASASEFQVISATHSPMIVDLAKPHTTLVRVVPATSGGVAATQVSHTLFTEDERETMKMLNYFDPYVCEAFFASNVLLVEGDTEAVAIRQLTSRMREAPNGNRLENLHVVNCGTKMNIPFFQKVLTHFRISHHIFHDLDSRFSSNGGANPAWTLNQRIWDGVLSAQAVGVLAIRYVFNREFESANGYELDTSVGKPFSAYRETARWDLTDQSRAAIRYLENIATGQPPNPEFTPQVLDRLAGEA